MKKSSKRCILIVVFLLVFITATSLTFGKYVYNSVWNYYLTSKGFYFDSDLLDINTKKNSILKWDGGDIYFNIKNSQNEELISEYDISYKVTCEVLGEESKYIKCNINNTELSTFNGNLASTANCINETDDLDVSSYSKAECQLKGYIWNEEITNKSNSFNLVLTDATKSIKEVSVKITAESLTPYHETLIGIFNLNRVDSEDLEIVTNYQNYDDYVELSISNTTTTDKCLLISFDESDYSLDLNLDSVLEYNTNLDKKINQVKVKVLNQKNLIYNLYKLNTNKVYSMEDILIEEKEC